MNSALQHELFTVVGGARIRLAVLNFVLHHAVDCESWMPLRRWLPWSVASNVHVRCAVIQEEQERERKGTADALACAVGAPSCGCEMNVGGREPTAE